MTNHKAVRHEAVLAIDLGKTSCRARVSENGEVLAEAEGYGSPGLAEHDGPGLAAKAILDTIALVPARARSRVRRIGIGAAGVQASPAGAATLSSELRRALGSGAPGGGVGDDGTGGGVDSIAIASDAIAAHAGAFFGGPGAVLIAGTGTVVIAVDEFGNVRQIDGWGPWLGDEGSGRWIGQRGFEAALRGADGRGPATLLTSDAEAVAGSLAALPGWVSQTGAPARRLGTFAPTVIARAEQGDDQAAAIVNEACSLLANAARAATASGTGRPTESASGPARVCVAGGIGTHPAIAPRLAEAITAVGVELAAPLGDALDGATLIAIDHTISYDGRVVRDDDRFA